MKTFNHLCQKLKNIFHKIQDAHHFDKLNISMYDIEVKYKIGEGAYGNVYRGNFFDQNAKCIPVAIKQLKVNEKQKDFLRESKIMSTLNHECIVKFHGYCSETKMILLELLFMGSLHDYLKTNYSQISTDLVKKWCVQIADGMRYLESISIIHRDLAARNILIKTIYQVKITDFGMARKIMPNEVYISDTAQKIPYRWYPLESIEQNIFTSKSDVWSYGVTIWEIYSFGMVPYENLNLPHLVSSLKRGLRLSCPYNCSSNWFSIMLKCWNIYPQNRPTFDYIFNYLNNQYR